MTWDETTESKKKNHRKTTHDTKWRYKGHFLKIFSKSSISFMFKCSLKYRKHLFLPIFYSNIFSPAKFTRAHTFVCPDPTEHTVFTADGYRLCGVCCRSRRRNYNAYEKPNRKKKPTPTKDDQENRYKCSFILSSSRCVCVFSLNFYFVYFLTLKINQKPERREICSYKLMEWNEGKRNKTKWHRSRKQDGMKWE